MNNKSGIESANETSVDATLVKHAIVILTVAMSTVTARHNFARNRIALLYNGGSLPGSIGGAHRSVSSGLVRHVCGLWWVRYQWQLTRRSSCHSDSILEHLHVLQVRRNSPLLTQQRK